MTEIAVRAHVLGRVQGVGYRDWAARRAAALGVTGWVRNRNDGAVEILAAGQEAAVMGFLEACKSGPGFAEVSGVEVAAEPDPGPLVGFRILG